jgi:hypothetical protein
VAKAGVAVTEEGGGVDIGLKMMPTRETTQEEDTVRSTQAGPSRHPAMSTPGWKKVSLSACGSRRRQLYFNTQGEDAIQMLETLWGVVSGSRKVDFVLESAQNRLKIGWTMYF